MTSRMCSVNLKLVNLPSIDLMISRSLWMKALPHPSVPSTPYLRRNLQLFVSSLMRTSLQGSFILPAPCVELQYSSSRNKMACFNFVSTSGASTASQKRIAIHFCSFPISWTHCKKQESIPKSTYGTLTTWYEFPLGTNGRLHSGPVMVPLSG